MIKYFCDRCGKEITGKVNEYTDTTEAIAPRTQKVVATWKTVEHICDECEQKELTCGFKVGDEVITSDGCIGVITDICTCDRCKERGFYEPEIEMKLGPQIWMTDSDKDNGFEDYYKVGNRVFGNINDKYLLGRMETLKEEMQEIEGRLNVIQSLINN